MRLTILNYLEKLDNETHNLTKNIDKETVDKTIVEEKEYLKAQNIHILSLLIGYSLITTKFNSNYICVAETENTYISKIFYKKIYQV